MSRLSAAVTVTATDIGWHVEGESSASPHPFTADLGRCPQSEGHKGQKATAPCPTGYHRGHVSDFVKRVARTYGPRVEAPTVPDLPRP